LNALWSAHSPLTVADIATQVGLHPNTVRFHLDGLLHQGLISKHSEEREMRGRPHILYSVIPAKLYAGRRNYRLLSQVLITFVSDNAHTKRRGLVASGEIWGRRLAAQRNNVEGTPATQRALNALEDLGFAPEMTVYNNHPRIMMNHCPFLEAAEQNPTTVCAVHLGLLRGLIQGCQAPWSVARLDPFVRPSLCVAALAAPV